jgi:hypothetical protein
MRRARAAPALAAWVAAIAVAPAGCSRGGGPASAPVAPTYPQADAPRPPTAATELLALAPAGAQVVVELDLGRVRDNPAVGALYRAFTHAGAPGGEAAAGAAEAPPFALFRDAELVVICSYDVGAPAAASLTLVRAAAQPDPGPRGARLDDRTVALGPAPLVARVARLHAGRAASVRGSMAGDPEFLRLRDAAMPERASAAAARVTARLPFDARIALANLLEVDAVPAALSVWGDVIDDLAVVALLSGDDAGDAADLAAAVVRWRDHADGHALVERWRLAPLLRRVVVERDGALARVELVVGPQALGRAARRLEARLRSIHE